MKKIGIRKWDKFVSEELIPELKRRYLDYRILSEADLESNVWQIIYDFIPKGEWAQKNIRILNEPFFKELRIHPDIVIFRKGKPWIIFELKEWSMPKERSVKKERKRIISSMQHFKIKFKYKLTRGYLLFVAKKESEDLKNKFAKLSSQEFSIIPIVASDGMDGQEFDNWKNRFKQWSKYIKKPGSRKKT